MDNYIVLWQAIHCKLHHSYVYMCTYACYISKYPVQCVHVHCKQQVKSAVIALHFN